MTAANCEGCGRSRIRVAERMCGDCYRDKFGDALWLDDNRRRLKCAEAGCDHFAAKAGGYCPKHEMRRRRHGHVEQTRPADWGARSGHPLYETWTKVCVRYRAHICEAWRADFWTFVKDVGERPTDRHIIYRITTAKPFEPGNTKWRGPKFDTQHDVATKEGRNAYMREWHKKDPMRAKSIYLQRRYGIDLGAFNEMYDTQGGKCAICGSPETEVDRRTGKPRNLAVDHCHATNKIRALLCTKCNTGIGSFHDDPALLRAAIAYLASHGVG